MTLAPAQNESGAVSEDGEGAALNDIKLLAQQSALPHLTGENPFVLRESWWSGTMKPGEARLIQIQLFRRNEYHFWLAVPSQEAGLNLNIYDGEGEIVETESVRYESTNIVSAIVKPDLTGLYYVRVSLKTTIDEPQEYAVIYGYR